MMNDRIKQIWDMIDFMTPKHFSSFNPRILCSDDKPFNWGNFGCKRCDMIRDIGQKKNDFSKTIKKEKKKWQLELQLPK